MLRIRKTPGYITGVSLLAATFVALAADKEAKSKPSGKQGKSATPAPKPAMRATVNPDDATRGAAAGDPAQEAAPASPAADAAPGGPASALPSGTSSLLDAPMPAKPGPFEQQSLLPEPGVIQPSILQNPQVSPSVLDAPNTAIPVPAGVPAPAAAKKGEINLSVSRFKLSYALGPNEKPNPKLPSISDLEKTTVRLGVAGNLLVPLDPKAPKIAAVPIVLGEAGKTRTYRGDAIEEVSRALVAAINKVGVYGVYVIVDPAEIKTDDGVAAFDKRGGKTELSLRIYVSEVETIRTIRRKVPFRTTDKPSIDDPRDAKIKAHSPVFAASELKTGGLLEKLKLQTYLSRLNRFPGRRVDAAINATGKERKVLLDYLIREEKPLFAYLQTSNTGTESTGEWRTRVGVDYKQFARMDDILRLEYITTDFSRYNAFLGSYEIAPIFPDYLKLKAFGTYSKYSAEDIGNDFQNFESTVWSGGLQATWTPLYVKSFPLDLYAGAQWMNVSVNNETAATKGESDFLLAYVGFGTERITEKFSLVANAQVQMNLPDLAGTAQDLELDALGRFETDRDFLIGSWNLSGSVFLEPIIFGKAWDEQKVWWKSTRAHELAASFRGQVALDDARLVPQLQMVVGGFDSVRGYPESFTSGDTALLAGAEYRFHIPRQFLKPKDVIEGEEKVKKTAAAAAAQTPDTVPEPPSRTSSQPDPFMNIRPPSIATGPDWDLIFRAFFDFGQTYNNRAIPNVEVDRTMASVGGGLELQLYRPLYVSLRADVGYVLMEQNELLTDPVDQGDIRFHFSGTIAW